MAAGSIVIGAEGARALQIFPPKKTHNNNVLLFSRSLPGDQVLGNYFVPPVFSGHATALGRVMNPNPDPNPSPNPDPNPNSNPSPNPSP